MKHLLDINSLRDIHYVEPFAGGAAVALELLFTEYASRIYINDLSRPVYAFWYCVLKEPDRLCRSIERADLSIEGWKRQRAVYERRKSARLSDLGYAALYLNRTNRSGILSAGPIGGKTQGGEWTLDVRFNAEELVRRIQKISRYRSRILLYHTEAQDFVRMVLPPLGRNIFVFYDPPYIERGEDLYFNDYALKDHRGLERIVSRSKQPWIMTYDIAAVSHEMYSGFRRVTYDLHYTAHRKYKAREVMFFSRNLRLGEVGALCPPTMLDVSWSL